MALRIVTGFTSDGLVFIKATGGAGRGQRDQEAVLTMERDQAEWLSKQLIYAAESAHKEKNRIIQPIGEPIIIKK